MAGCFRLYLASIVKNENAMCIIKFLSDLILKMGALSKALSPYEHQYLFSCKFEIFNCIHYIELGHANAS